MADEKISIGWEVQLKELQDQLKASNSVADKQVKELVGSLRKSFKKTEDDAKRSAERVSREWQTNLADIKRGAEKISGMIGGPIGDLGDIVFDLGEKVGSVGGVLGTAGAVAAGAGVAFAVAGVGAVTFAEGMVSLANEASNAEARLDSLGRAAEIPMAAHESLAAYREEQQRLAVEIDKVTVALGADAASGLAPVIAFTADLVSVGGELWAELREIEDALAEVTAKAEAANPVWALMHEVIQGLTNPLGTLPGLLRDVREALGLNVEKTDDLAAAERKRWEMMKEHGAAEESYEKIRETAIKQTERQVQGQEALADAWAEARAELEKIAQATREAVDAETLAGKEGYRAALVTLDGYQRQQAALDDMYPSVMRLQAVMGEWQNELNELADSGAVKMGAFSDQISDAADKISGKLNKYAPIFDTFSAGIDMFAAANERAFEASAEAHQKAMADLDEREAAEKKRIDRLEETGRITSAQADAERRLLERGTEAARRDSTERLQIERDRLAKAWKRTQAFQIAAAAIESVRAGISMIPAFAAIPIIGVAAPLEAAAAAGIAFETARANIMSQEPPELPMGMVPQGNHRSPDHPQTYALRNDEVVLSPRGTDRYERMNRGQEAGAGAIHIHLGPQLVQTLVMDEVRREARMKPAGQWTAGRRNVYGGRG